MKFTDSVYTPRRYSYVGCWELCNVNLVTAIHEKYFALFLALQSKFLDTVSLTFQSLLIGRKNHIQQTKTGIVVQMSFCRQEDGIRGEKVQSCTHN